jgi:flagellar export protein FliJ
LIVATRFRFRLDPLITLRKTKRDALRSELSRNLRVVNEMTRQIEEIHRSIAQGVQDARTMLTGGSVDLSAVRLSRHQSSRLQGELLKAEQSFASATQETDTARKQLLEASKELEVVERLKEKALARHRDSLAREEQAMMDEIGSQMHWRSAHGFQPVDHS